AYLIIFPVVYGHTNITTRGYRDANNHMPAVGSRIFGVVNKESLMYLKAGGIYKTNTTLKSHVIPVSLETALGSVKNKYKNVLIRNPIMISNIALTYLPTIDNSDSIQYKLIPAWILTGTKKITYTKDGKQFKRTASFTIYIDGVTG